jgi:manganese-dependent inorganic pyrophosphatase
MKIVTAYENPDLDGTACAYAYSELLNKQNIKTKAVIYGKPHREAQFILNKLGIKIPNGRGRVNKLSEVIFVDCSDVRGTSKIRPSQVSEIIDHRKFHTAEKFKNAKVQIELVGAAATLIGEKFFKAKIKPSYESALLLYTAIASNTINFKNNVTTERDKKIAKWLKDFYDLDGKIIEEMFREKSKINRPLREIFLEDKAVSEINKNRISVFQLEILEVEKLIKERVAEIKEFLSDYKKEEKLDIIFLTCVDLMEGFNMFVVVDSYTQNILENVLKVKFNNGISKREGILMRKEILPLIKDYLEN